MAAETLSSARRENRYRSGAKELQTMTDPRLETARWLAAAEEDPRKVFERPLDVVDLADLSHTQRHSILQRWLALSAQDGEGYERWKEILGAIGALGARAELEMDKPSEAPDVTTYGVVQPTDHRKK
jgi:hypothetical protein